MRYIIFLVLWVIPMSSTFAWQAPDYDLLLKGGHVIDPRNGIDALYDVAVQGEKIARVDQNISVSSAKQVIDVSGLYVTPGLIEMHGHVNFIQQPNNQLTPEDRTMSCGITTMIDVGSVGWQTFTRFKELVVDLARIRILALLNVAGPGMGPPEQEVSNMHPGIIAAMIKQYPDILVGVKSAHYSRRRSGPSWDDEHPPAADVENALKAAELAGVPLMADFYVQPPQRTYERMMGLLRPGDVHAHVFSERYSSIMPDGSINPILMDARRRGVLMEIGFGAANLLFDNAIPAIKQGFYPDIISGDIIVLVPELDLPTVMSTFIAMGMPLQDVIKCATMNPADAIRRPELGSLSVGAGADIAVFEMEKGWFGFIDRVKVKDDRPRRKIMGDKKLVAQLTVFKGDIIYDREWRHLPEWKSAK